MGNNRKGNFKAGIVCAKVRLLTMLILSLAVLVCGSGCFGKSGASSFNIDSVKSYRDIPGVTDTEIKAIEALKTSRKSFSFGAMPSTEGFVQPDGTYAGFSTMLCELLSGLFGVPFDKEFHDWDTLKNGLDSAIIDFTSEYSPTPELKNTYFMTHPIAKRSLGVFTYGNSARIESESNLNGLTIGFYENTTTADSIRSAYPSLFFDEVHLTNNQEAIEMLEAGVINAFIIETVESYAFANNPFIRCREMLPLVYTPVSLATINPQLMPVIAAVNKYIEAGGIDNLYKLYSQGRLEYGKYAFGLSITTEEKAYLDNLAANGVKVPIALEADNYPISFFYEKEKKFQGVAPDILAEISKITGIKFEVVTGRNTPWMTIIEKLRSGEIALVSELLYTEERKDNFLFSDPYFTSRYALLSKSDYPNLEIFQVVRTTVGLGRGSAYEEIYRAFFPDNYNVKRYPSQSDAIRALENGEIDLYMASENVLLTMRNYQEKPDYKANIIFNTPIEESLFGFNRDEVILCSVMGKAQNHIDKELIGKDWTGRMYNYSRKIANLRFLYLAVLAFVLSMALVVVFILFVRNSRLKKHFEDYAITISTMYKTIPDLLYCMDADCKFTNCNRTYEEFTGLSESDVIGKTDLEIYAEAFDQEAVKGFMDMNKKVISEGVTITREDIHVRPDSGNIILKSTKTPLIQNGRIVGLLGISRDITEYRAAEEAAQEASRAKTNFLARMSHEIRTPMNAIIGMTELALRENELGAIYKHISTVKQAGVHLLSIINDILDFSKIEVGRLEIFRGEYPVSSLINDVISIIRMRVIDSQMRFAVNIDSNIPSALVGDETRIRQVLLNLLTNAVKYTEKGFISFTAGMETIDENTINLVMKVEDSGKGIRQEDIEKLFREYVQIDPEKNRGIEGVGLGLAITWNIVKAMGGEITVNSEYGKGSVFTVTIPQKISSNKPLASVETPRDIKVIVYERREIYANSIICSIENLGVGCSLVSNISELLIGLAGNAYTFIFISFSLYQRNKKAIMRFAGKAKIVVLAEFGEAIPDKRLSVLAMPVYSISIANILNGITESFNFSESDEELARFIAPDAKVLVVDDVSTNLKVAEGLMLPYKMQLDFCKGGREAVEAILFKRYDLVFMDHKMPGMDGVEATREIRKLGGEEPYYGRVPIIALTANAVSGSREAFLGNGFNDFLSKPIDTVKLNVILEKWIPKEKQKDSPGREKKASAETDKYPVEINGVNITRGVFLSGGTLESFLETLAIFHKDGLEKIIEINGSLRSGDIDLYTVHVHALKSASANIGALDLSEDARLLEVAGEQRDMDYVESHTHQVLSALEELLNDIGGVLAEYRENSGEKENSCDMELLESELRTLKSALEVLDAGVINSSIEALQKTAQAGDQSEVVQSIANKILIGEYEEAAESAAALLKELADEAR